MIRPLFPVVVLFLTLSTAAGGPVAGGTSVQASERSRLPCLPGSTPSSCELDGPNPVYWFSLGDSYTETGFNASGPLPSSENPFGNPAYPGFTGAGGPNWLDYMTTTYNKSLVLTYNLARGGATIDSTLVPPGQGVSLTDEVNTFLSKFAKRPPSTRWKTRNTLFSWWIGINDIGYTYNNGGDQDAFADKLLDSYFALVEQLVGSFNIRVIPMHSNSGARFFLFINVPPVDLTPVVLARSAEEQALNKAAILGYNRKLWQRIDYFEGNHSDATVWRWDSHAAFTAILDDPEEYGFRDATSVGNDSTYFWGNAYHPGSSAHMIFAQQISDLLKETLW